MARSRVACWLAIASGVAVLVARLAPSRLFADPGGPQGTAAVLLAGVGTAGTKTPGGQKNVGRLFAENLIDMGASVACVARNEAAAEELRSIGCQVAGIGDLMDPAFAQQVMQSTQPVTVFTAVGGKDEAGNRVDGIANINLFKAAAELRAPPHVVFLTSWGCGETWDYLNDQTRNILGAALRAKTEAEDFLRASGLRFIIVRPGGLMAASEPPTRRGILIRDRPDVGGAIRRQDLAQMLLWLPRRADTNGIAVTALDRDMARADPPLRDSDIVPFAAPG